MPTCPPPYPFSSRSAVLIFSQEDVSNLNEFMLNLYFRHYNLYKYTFTKKLQVTLVQSETHHVEVPRMLRPLSEAIPQVSERLPSE